MCIRDRNYFHANFTVREMCVLQRHKFRLYNHGSFEAQGGQTGRELLGQKISLGDGFRVGDDGCRGRVGGILTF